MKKDSKHKDIALFGLVLVGLATLFDLYGAKKSKQRWDFQDDLDDMKLDFDDAGNDVKIGLNSFDRKRRLNATNKDQSESLV
jgi:hypothetical protein